MGGMVRHRIKELREDKGWSQERLGAAIGRTKSVVSRLESGQTSLDLETAYRIAEALDVTIQDVLGIEHVARGFADEIVPYKGAPNDPFRSFEDGHRFLFTATTDLLDLAGVNEGDVLIVNDSAEACARVRPLQIVSVLYHPSSNGKAVHILRQYVPPRALITNGSRGNERTIDMGTEDATIVGVVESVHRKIGPMS